MPDDRRPAVLEDRLRAIGREFDVQLGARDLTSEVARRIVALASPAAADRRRARRRRVVVAFAVALAAIALLVPAVAAITSFFDVGAVRIYQGTAAPGPVTNALDLGTPTTLVELRARTAVAVPTAAGFKLPDQVWVDHRLAGDPVSLVYRDRPGLPAAAHTEGVGLLIQEFTGDGTPSVSKYLNTDATAQPVTVGSEQGVFLTGGEHSLYYVDRTGTERAVKGRLAGQTLIFQRGARTIRIEGELPLDRMLAVATSMR